MMFVENAVTSAESVGGVRKVVARGKMRRR